MGQQIASSLNTPSATPPVIPVAGGMGGGGSAELLGSAEVARQLGVSEADVLATLEKGELKGKKIGSTWRVTKSALDEF